MTIMDPGEREGNTSLYPSGLSGRTVLDWGTPLLSPTGPISSLLDENDGVVMLDPSLFLGEGGFEWFLEVPAAERANFVISTTFFEQVAGRIEYTVADSQLWGQLPEEPNRGQLEGLLAGLTFFSGGDIVGELSPEDLAVAERLQEMGSQVAVEEWLYLQSNSWVAARSRNIVDHFARAGAKTIEMLGSALNDVTWAALGQRPGDGRLTPRLRGRAGANVLIAGSVGTLTAIMPWFGIPGAILMLLYAPYARPRDNTRPS